MQKSQGAFKAEFYSIGFMHEQILTKRALLRHTRWLHVFGFIVYLVYPVANAAAWSMIIMSETLFDTKL